MRTINLKRRLAAYVRQRMRGRVLYAKQGREPLYVSTVIRFVRDGFERKADISVFRKLEGGSVMPLAVFYVVSSAEYEEARTKAHEFVNCHNYSLMEAFVLDCERMRLCVFKGNGDRDTYSKVLGKDVKSMFRGAFSVKVTRFDAIGDTENEFVDRINFPCIGMSGTVLTHDTACMKFRYFLDFKWDAFYRIIGDEFFVAGPNNGLLARSHGRKPDIVVTKLVDHDIEDLVPYIIIEADHTMNMKKNFDRIEEYMEMYKPSSADPANSNKHLLEYYVFNFQTREWYSFGPNADPERPSYSKMLDADLDDALYYDRLDYMKTTPLPPVQKPAKEPTAEKTKKKVKK